MLGGDKLRAFVITHFFGLLLQWIPQSAIALPRVSIPDGTAVWIAKPLGPQPNLKSNWEIFTWNQQAQDFESRVHGSRSSPHQKFKQLKIFGGVPSAAVFLDVTGHVWLARWDHRLQVPVAQITPIEGTQKARCLSESSTGDVLILWETGGLTQLHSTGSQSEVFSAQDFRKLGIETAVQQIQQTGTDAYTALSLGGIHRLAGSRLHGEIEWTVETLNWNALRILDMPTQSFSTIREVEQVVASKDVVYLAGYLNVRGQKAANLYAIDLNRSALLGEAETQAGNPPLLLGLAPGNESKELILFSNGHLKQFGAFMGTRGESPDFLKSYFRDNVHAESILWDWPTQITDAPQRNLRSSQRLDPHFQQRIQDDLSQLKGPMLLRDFIRFISGYTPQHFPQSIGPIRELFTYLTDVDLLQIGLYRYHRTYELVDGKERALIDRTQIYGVLQTALKRQRAANLCSAHLLTLPPR